MKVISVFFGFAFALKSLAQHNPFPSSKNSDFQTRLSAKPLLGKLLFITHFHINGLSLGLLHLEVMGAKKEWGARRKHARGYAHDF